MAVVGKRRIAIEAIAADCMPDAWCITGSDEGGGGIHLRLERQGDCQPYWVQFPKETLDDSLFHDDGSVLSERGREWLTVFFRDRLEELPEGDERIFLSADIE
ncbi:hypothetical protein [Natronospira bacteriovora]|uniref:Uncharacterized protein n=1 Tax=Natronospira bacteriovora TaxID=3069753 RepID=A0ABU0W6W4_9GAMM|nr:hypothetical protein [Natronospira sp. AB-CW4]MDQ2069205.1 hypothetical protein [Natronospira sp. AB-CW4]